MNVVVIGLNHNTASIEIREKLAFDGPKLEKAAGILKNSPEIKEHIILSTCNRVELYAAVKEIASGTEGIKKFIADFHSIPREALDKALYVRSGRNAIKHIFRVASSLDSMVVGEPQILGQLKDAFDFSLKNNTTSVLLNRLMRKTISVAKRVRTETKIGESAVSISFAAVELAKKIFEDLQTKPFMLIGAGEMAELAVRHLINNGVKDVLVTNRTFERAEELAKEFNGRGVEFDKFQQELTHTDIVICSTGAPNYILFKDAMLKIMRQRKNRPMFIIDISVPRNIDPKINDIDNIYLYNIDDLQGIVNSNIEERSREAEKSERIIDEEVESFLMWQESLSATPTIVALREKAEAVKKEEMERLMNRFPNLGEKEKKAIEIMAGSIVNKLIHPPTAALKEDSEDREALISMIRRLFGIGGDEGN